MSDCVRHHDDPKPATHGHLCQHHSQRIQDALADLPELWCWANGELHPGKGDGRGNEQPLGLNVAALDFVTLNAVLPELYAWERVVVEERLQRDMPVYADRRPATLVGVCAFLVTHHEWICEQDWVDEYASAIGTLHRSAQNASRIQPTAQTRILCPTSYGDGTACEAPLRLSREPDETTVCRRCGREWSQRWLLRVLIDATDAPLYLDAPSIADFLNLSPNVVRRYGWDARRLGILYEMHDVTKRIPKNLLEAAALRRYGT